MKAVLERKLDFIGYPNYSVDTEGNVWSYFYNKQRKLKGLNNKGYFRVQLFNEEGDKYIGIHRLVAMAFIPNPDNKPFIDHINGNGTDNRIENLRWCTHKENCNNPITLKRHSESKKGGNNPMFGRLGKNNPKSKVVLQYTKDGQFVAEYPTAKDAQLITSIHRNAIGMCCRGTIKTSGGYIWKYKEEGN